MIFDTDITVWMLRRYGPALRFAEGIEPAQRSISAISHIELLYGCRDRKELSDLQELLSTWFAAVIPVTPAVTRSAEGLMERFALSRRPDLADVLIAAAALDLNEPVVSCNRKHFDFIPGLELRIFRP